MKIIDRYILARFLYNFLSSFAILMFIFIFQTIWLFIDELSGKDLDLLIIGKFLFYYTPTLIDKVLPLTVLLSSILTFGTFAENYEFAAMKASGISLQRAMASLIVFCSLLGIATFFLANNVIPSSEQKIFNMRKNIAKIKPAAVIVEGIFSDIEGSDMNIKVERKYGPNDRMLEDVIIHQKNNLGENKTVIRAERGELLSSEDSDIIQLILYDGHYYEDVQARSAEDKRKQPFFRSDFETYVKNIDVSDLDDQDVEAENDVVTDKMKNVVRLRKDIDSIGDMNRMQVRAFSKNIINRMGLFPPANTTSFNTAELAKLGTYDTIVPDTLLHLVPEWQRLQVINSAKNAVSNITNNIGFKKEELEKRFEIYNRHILQLNKKFALAFSCIILFFVGAPLGALIRKGGIGLPMVVAIVLFLAYYFIGVFAENYSKRGNLHPMLGAWVSTLVMMPLGVFFTRRATRDKGLMGIGNRIESFFKRFRRKPEEVPDLGDAPVTQQFDDSVDFVPDPRSEAYQVLAPMPNHSLREIALHSDRFGYDEVYRNTAVKLLEQRGVGLEELKREARIQYAQRQKNLVFIQRFRKKSRITVLSVLAFLVLAILVQVLLRSKVPPVAIVITTVLALVGYGVYWVNLVRSTFLYDRIFDLAQEKAPYSVYWALLIDHFIFPFVYFARLKEIDRIEQKIKGT